MNSHLTESPPLSQRPDILQIIGARVDLHLAGKQYSGLCPLHAEKTPSFTVNEEKGVFYCHGCHEGGDVIAFVQKIDGLTFPEALRSLGMNGEQPRRRVPTSSRQRAAELAVAWSNQQRSKFNVMIADTMALRDTADGAFDVAEIFDRELVVLRGFYDALQYPSGIAEMLASRPSIESITDGAEVSL